MEQAQAAGISFCAIVADCFYGDNNALEAALLQRSLPQGTGAPQHCSFRDAARSLPLPARQPVIRPFRDGYSKRWWAAELMLFGYGPDQPVRAVCATTDRRALPALSTCYLTTNLSREQAPLGKVVRLYGLRNWVEQSYKQMKDELGWADFMVRSDRAIRRHWTLVCCAFAFCWWHAVSPNRASESSTPPEARIKTGHVKPLPCWPRLLRAWLTPAYWLARCWTAIASEPPPAELAALFGALTVGHGINLYLRL